MTSGRELGNTRYFEVNTTAETYVQLCSTDKSHIREITLDDVTDDCSAGLNEVEPVEIKISLDLSGVVKADNAAYLKILTQLEDTAVSAATFARLTVKYITPTFTYAGDVVISNFKEDAGKNAVRFSFSAQYTGAVTRTST